MKFLIALSFIITTSISFGQDYSDTIYYKNGMVRAGYIYQESNSSIKYYYLKDNGKEVSSMARKSLLQAYTVGDKQNSVATDFTSPSMSGSTVSTGVAETENDPKKVITRVAVVLGVALIVPITLLIGLLAL